MLTPNEVDTILKQDHYYRLSKYTERRLQLLELAIEQQFGWKPHWDSIADTYRFTDLPASYRRRKRIKPLPANPSPDARRTPTSTI